MAARKRKFVKAEDLSGEEAKAILSGIQKAIWLRDEYGDDGLDGEPKVMWVPFADDMTSDEVLTGIIEDLEKAGMRPPRRMKA